MIQQMRMKQIVQRLKIDAKVNLQLLNFQPGSGESPMEMRNADAWKVQKVNFQSNVQKLNIEGMFNF